MCQHFSGHNVKQLCAAIRSLAVTNIHWLNAVAVTDAGNHGISGRAIAGKLRKHLWEVLYDLENQKESTIVEGYLMLDHIHMCISIAPKHSVSHVIGFIKGKSAIAIARQLGKGRNFTGESFWARRYFVSTVGLNEEAVRAYIRDQEKADERYDQLRLGM